MARVDLAERTRRAIAADDWEATRRTQQKIADLQAIERRFRTRAGLTRASARVLREVDLLETARNLDKFAKEDESQAGQLRRMALETGHQFKRSRPGRRRRQRLWGRLA
jgi:hypothetical protein